MPDNALSWLCCSVSRPLGRLADNRDDSWGDLFLTADGLVIFAPAHESGPSWTVPLDEISEATDAGSGGLARPGEAVRRLPASQLDPDAPSATSIETVRGFGYRYRRVA